MTGNIEILVFSIASIAFFSGITIWIVIVDRRNRTINETSIRLSALRDINSRYEFASLDDIRLENSLDSKRQFDRFDEDGFLMAVMDADRERYAEVIRCTLFNRELKKRYDEEVDHIPPSRFEKDSWQKVEFDFFKDELLHPMTSPSIVLTWSYISPQGRNYYQQHATYDFAAIVTMYNDSLELREQRQDRRATIARERALMTDSLRYDVMRRDGFRCVLCGSSQRDGVKLEIDHILPISKGGKTEMSNLRTLCDRCNRGKRDKIEGIEVLDVRRD